MACITEAGRGGNHRPLVNRIGTDVRSLTKAVSKSEYRKDRRLFLNCAYANESRITAIASNMVCLTPHNIDQSASRSTEFVAYDLLKYSPKARSRR